MADIITDLLLVIQVQQQIISYLFVALTAKNPSKAKDEPVDLFCSRNIVILYKKV